MTTQTFKGASAMPAPTWHFLRMNDVDIEIPADLAITHDAQIEGALTGGGAFEEAMDAAQVAYDAAFGDKPFLANYEDEQANRLGGLALSRYQKNADAAEAAKDLRATYEQGLGQEAGAWLRDVAGEPQAIVAAQGETRACSIKIDGVDGHVNATAIDLVAQAGATLDVNISVDSPTAGSGITGSTLRIFAAEGARVTVRRVQTLDDSWTDLDDMGLFLADSATIEVYQTVLGAGKTFTGLAGDLRGYASTANVYTHYLGHGQQQLDFNYILRHHGAKTTCKLYANGVLAGSSSKTLRGTIDLIRGGKGAVGQEIDNVLLVDEGVRNKTVPTILCNEDDVMGTHGATIGHIKPEQLFYLASRGLSQEQAEGMFITASLEDAWINAADEPTRQAVARLGNTLVENFEEVYL
jgi:Fe-S cluster assembly protein SufD